MGLGPRAEHAVVARRLTPDLVDCRAFEPLLRVKLR